MEGIGRKEAALLLAIFVAAASTVTVSAKQAASEKEEVVYGQLAADGSTERIYVVNIFENQKDILDYGNYSDVRNMTSQDEVSRTGDKITLHTEEDTLYYQGNLEKGQLPWDIGISYFLNGEQIHPKDLAGKSGNLEIRIQIEENKKAFPAFFENYALQVTAVFDMEKCETIRAKGATEANAGGNRQFTWTLLPQTSRTITIKTRVTDFEMEPISFNGVRLNMDVNVDTGELEEKFDALSETIEAIDSGAKKLSAGTKAFSKGAQRLSGGMGQLNQEMETLSGKAKDAENLKAASGTIKGAVNALYQGTSKIKEAVSYQAFKAQMKESGLDLDSLKAGNRQLLETLSQLKTMETIPTEYRQQILRAEQVLNGNLAALGGMEQYLEAAAKGIAETAAGAESLSENYGAFDSAIRKLSRQFSNLDISGLEELKEGADALAQGSEQLSEGSSALSGGTEALSKNTSNMSGRIDTAIDDMMSGISGKTERVISFVSEKNTNVKAVQFVIKNEAVERSEKEPPTESEPESLSWWQKILKLFKAS